MPEEKKEENQEVKPGVKPEIKQPEAPIAVPATAPAEVTPTAAPAAPAPEKKEAEEPKIEKPDNCAACNKSIKKILHYYRNGKFYCNKRCWKTTLKKDEVPPEPKA